MSNQQKREPTHETVRLRLSKELVGEIDSALTNPALSDYSRVDFIRFAVLFALDSIYESSQNQVPCDIEITNQINVPEAKTEFAPYIHAVGEVSVPRGITLFAVFGGHKRWTTIPIPATVLSLPISERLEQVPELISAYLEKYGGQVPFFGAVTAFVYVCESEYYEFDRDGLLVGHFDESYYRGLASVSSE
jgi:hypothetical protein